MCLTRVTTNDYEFPETMVGYKWFEVELRNNKYYFNAPTRGYSFKINKWNRCKSDILIRSNFGGDYKSGFHIFEKLKEAKKAEFYSCVLAKVICQNIVASGRQYGCDIIVAKSMFIYPTIIKFDRDISAWKMEDIKNYMKKRWPLAKAK